VTPTICKDIYMGTIYILENKINKKCYVGQTIQLFTKRFRSHCQSHSIIGKALRKYGVENFNKILIEDIQETELDKFEVEYIQKYNSISPNGYNLETGGHKNKHISEETKIKIGEGNKGKYVSEETKRKISKARKKQIMKPHSEETKIKIGEGNKGKYVSEETKKKLSESHKGQIAWNKGKHPSEETKRKMSEARKGRVFKKV
jgi:group I intron endonuclease